VVLTLALAAPLAAWPQAGAPPPAPSSATQAALVARVLALWKPEELAVRMVQQPALDAAQQAHALLQTRVSPQRREAAMQAIAADLQAFVADAAPIARQASQRLLPSTVSVILAERFSEPELAQLVALLESPVRAKFEQLLPEMQRKLGAAVSAQTRAQIDPKLGQLSQVIAERLRSAAAP